MNPQPVENCAVILTDLNLSGPNCSQHDFEEYGKNGMQTAELSGSRKV